MRIFAGPVFGWIALAAIAISIPAQVRSKASEPGIQNQLDSNEALFTVLAAMNVAGYDDPINAVSTHPFRHTLRAQLGTRNLESAYALKRFFSDRQLKDPTAELSRYISYGLLIKGPPDFTYRDPDFVRPPDATSLEGLSPLLAAFYREAHLEEQWKAAQPFYERMIEEYHAPVSRAILESNAYLRQATSGYLGRSFQIYVDLLGAPNHIQTRSYGDETLVVVTPSSEPQVEGIRHAFLHYSIDPLVLKFAKEINTKKPLGDYALGAPALPQIYKDSFGDLAGESLIKAIESRLDRKPVLLEQAMKEGYILAPGLGEQLALYEKQDAAMRLYFAQLFTGLDFKREEQRLANLEFKAPAQGRLVRSAQSLKPPELTGAAKTVDNGELAYLNRDLPRAKATFLKVMEQTDERPLHAKAYYGLARIAVLERDPETGDQLFRKALESEPDSATKAWCLLYLGRLADAQNDRVEAVTNYKAALEVEGAPEMVRQAAEKGLNAAFKR